MRLFEVRIAPGQSSRPARTRYPAIHAIDTQRAFDALDAVVGPAAGRSLPPTGLALPHCITLDAGVAPALRNPGNTALHYYRLEFKRIEGAALKDRWRAWYPAMATMR